MKMMNRLSALIVLPFMIAAPRTAEACAMCGLSPGDHAGHAFNTSVLFMLSAPYVIFGAAGLVFYVAWRNSRRNRIDSVKERN